MSLKEKLMDDLKAAMKDKDNIRKNAIQMARSAVLQVEKDSRITLDDDGILEIIAKEVKKRRDSLTDYEKSGRQDLIDGLKAEIDVLLKYLPEQLTEDQLEVIVKEAINETGAGSASDIGKVMQAVLPKVKGRADGKMVNNIVKKYLG
ncbi:GatB/YqeY domain-containing protein [Acetivibrio mesophilus]|uniref:GatB/YqeY domain-containing protein n=1 Tax=Acetivibrio mesophilus TaxID=2487273 RepID=A0A4Q0I6T8_9FIRM|nr:GatB/YqeY domain-containing protein [Acetivibrio mesophilus]ODM24856.1 aspartyl-tRNA amidotransferase [Clostridium sp. Bc-iso-3]RXE58692.1 GatB/YqeY domain-containing protein [Acetivibrio mesophilus]HHV29383.1 GatB/YqeY domain-containing protein [Clostridium sp.]